jgi:tetratricopeptide (TPR) repeat protein
VNELVIGLVGALIATNQPLAVSNLIQQNTGVSVALPNANDPAERELQKVMADERAARDEVDKWIRDNNAFAVQGAGKSPEALDRRIRARLEAVHQGYEDLLRRYPDFADGHMAYGDFLKDSGDEEAAGAQYGKAAQLDPKNPEAWNQLANYCGEYGPVTNAFTGYAKAIALNPAEPVYYQNFATTVFLFRKDAMAFYGLTEPQVFDKSLALYRQAMQQAPQDFLLAADYAESYYGIRPLRTNDALAAWTNVFQIAHNDVQRQSVALHLARLKTHISRFAEARAHINSATNAELAEMKRRLERSLADHESRATNPPAATSPTNPPAAPGNASPSGP